MATEERVAWLKKKILQLLREPRSAISILWALLKGSVYIAYFRIATRNVRIKFPFFVYQGVAITGPGSVSIDRFCAVYPNTFEGLCIVTLDPGAEVRIGMNCALGGVTIRCRERIDIGDRVMVGRSLVQDCILVECPAVGSNVAKPQEIRPRPIRIGRNVWLGAQSCILCGSKIGDDSVVSLGAVCFGAEIEEYHLASGNPCLRPVPISRLIRMQDARK